MANFAYTGFKANLLEADSPDFNAPDDIRIVPCMTNTTADTEQDATTGADITTLDEFDGSGYSANGAALDGEAVSKDDANNRGEFTATDEVLSSISAGTRDIQGLALIKFITNLTLSEFIAWIDTGGFPITPNGGDITFQWNAEGIVQAT